MKTTTPRHSDAVIATPSTSHPVEVVRNSTAKWKSFSGIANLSKSDHLVHADEDYKEFHVTIKTGVKVRKGDDFSSMVACNAWQATSSGKNSKTHAIIIKGWKADRDLDGTAIIDIDILLGGWVTVYSFGFSVFAST